MSVLLAVTEQAPTVVQAVGLFDWASSQLNELRGVIQLGMWALAAGIFLYVAAKSKGSLAGIVVGAVTAIVIVYVSTIINPHSKPAELIDDQIDKAAPTLVISLDAGQASRIGG